MTELSKQIFFSGDEEVDADDLGKIEVTDFAHAVDRTLHNAFNWDGMAIGVVGLTLTEDNGRVANGVFITRGDTGLSEFTATCDQIWPEGPAHVTLAINVKSLNPFTFSRGGLWSDLIPQERFLFSFYDKLAGATNAPILGTPEGEGIGEFCLRVVCQPSSTSSGRKGVVCKYMILLFPSSAEELSCTPEAQFAGWPGLKIGDGYFPLGPAPSRKWQCPILPLIRPGTSFSENNTAPSSYRLRFAIAGVMTMSVQPDTARGSNALLAKWEKIRTNPRELTEKGPATCWPATAPFQEEQGKTFFS